ncbi:glutamic acid-rich protein-like [Clarias gariepinus]|uniref:glutamic acid-rich protein-like n=1 Tax=Clarias gariepinus TaxID=13013 RepID=UPI00234E09BE|nr:glutamic acid-rich protein-like [Clarias gariepinus]XP_053335815.1 glutamic acid-rich protein-like [Clarias gariepinus]
MEKPVEIIVEQHRLLEKEIRKYMKKWHDKTKGYSNQWPTDGSFNIETCTQLRQKIISWGAEKKKKEMEEKLKLKLMIIDYFKEEGQRRQKRQQEKTEQQMMNMILKREKEIKENEQKNKAKHEETEIQDGEEETFPPPPEMCMRPPPYNTEQPQENKVYPTIPMMGVTTIEDEWTNVELQVNGTLKGLARSKEQEPNLMSAGRGAGRRAQSSTPGSKNIAEKRLPSEEISIFPEEQSWKNMMNKNAQTYWNEYPSTSSPRRQGTEDTKMKPRWVSCPGESSCLKKELPIPQQGETSTRPKSFAHTRSELEERKNMTENNQGKLVKLEGEVKITPLEEEDKLLHGVFEDLNGRNTTDLTRQIRRIETQKEALKESQSLVKVLNEMADSIKNITRLNATQEHSWTATKEVSEPNNREGANEDPQRREKLPHSLRAQNHDSNVTSLIEIDMEVEGEKAIQTTRALRDRSTLRQPDRYSSTTLACFQHERCRREEERKRQVDEDEPTASSSQCPLIVKGTALHYVPWSFMDVTGLISRLPDLCEGAQRWITQFEEKTMGHQLALGDIKAILGQTIGKNKTTEVLQEAGMPPEAEDARYDHYPLGPNRNAIWGALRKMYPTKMDPGRLETIKLAEEENVVKFIQNFQDAWRE